MGILWLFFFPLSCIKVFNPYTLGLQRVKSKKSFRMVWKRVDSLKLSFWMEQLSKLTSEHARALDLILQKFSNNGKNT